MRVLKYGVLVLGLLQMPFLYYVCQTHRLSRYLRDMAETAVGARAPFQDLRGSIHVHSAAGSHSLGTYIEIIQAAKEAGYGYILITDHPREYQLFNQVQDSELVVIYGFEENREDGIRQLRGPNSEVKIACYHRSGELPLDVTGIEVFNLAQSAVAHNDLMGWMNWLYHQFSYPDLFVFQIWNLDQAYLDVWDQQTLVRKLAAFAGNNAHQNVGIMVITGTGQRLLSIFLDPYVSSLRFVTNHVLIPEGRAINGQEVLGALRLGSSYICFEQIGDPTGFSFHAISEGMIYPMGSEVPVGSQLVFQSPSESRFRLFQSGRLIHELEGRRFTFDVAIAGTYRVEVYLLNPPSLLREKPWILSNPIYVRGLSEKEEQVRAEQGGGT